MIANDGLILALFFGLVLLVAAIMYALIRENRDLIERLESQVEERTRALRDSEAELKAIFAAMEDSIVVLNAEGKYIKVQQTRWEYKLGSPEELVGKYLRDLISAPQVNDFLSAIQQALREQKTVNIEYVLPLVGEDRWFSASVSPMTDEYVIWVARDITQQKQASEQFRRLLDGLPVPIVITSETDGTVKYVNDLYQSTMKAPPEGVIGRKILSASSNPDDYRQLLNELEEKQTIHNRERQLERWDGTKIWVLFSTQKIVLDGEPALLTGFIDITQRKQMREELAQREANFRALFDDAPTAILIVNERGEITLTNKFADDMFGYEHQELVGRPLEILLPKRFRQKHVGYRNDYFTEPRTRAIGQGLDLVGQRKDGTEFAVEIGLNYIETPEGRLAMGFVIDIEERNAAEEMRQRLAAIVEASDDAIIGKTPPGIITSWNKGAEQIYGYTAEEAVGQHISMLLLPEQASESDKILAQINRGERVQLLDALRVKKTGETVHVSLSVFPVIDEPGQVVAASAIARDITRQRAAEKALRDSEEKYRQIVETAQEGIWLLDAENRTTFANQKLADMLGVTVEDMLSKTNFDFMDAEMRAVAQEKVQQRREGRPDRFEFRYRRADGSPLWVLISTAPLFSDTDEYIGALAMLADITERKQAEFRLQVLLDVLAAISSAADFDAAVSVTLRLICEHTGWAMGEAWLPGIERDSLTPGRSYHVDPSFHSQREPYHISNEQGLLGRIWRSRLPEWWQDISEVMDDDYLGMPHITEAGFTAALGIPIMFSQGILAILVFYMAQYHQDDVILIDLVEAVGTQLGTVLKQKLDQQELEHRTQDLMRSNTELQQFAYVASHDLQEPLRMVTSYLQLLERRYKSQLDQDAEEFIGYAVDGATRMKQLITDLLMFSRVGTHGKSFDTVDCEDVLAQVLRTLEPQIAESEAVVTHDPLPMIVADDTQMIQLFQNLISNALKFRGDAPPKVHIGVQRHTDHWQFNVCDNGIGIERSYQERIFVIFQRLHNRTQYSGTGIGLAVCKKIVERHGGRIWVESEAGSGSTFYFTIPVLEKKAHG